MAAGIVKGIDVGIVGMTETLGKTWHRMPEYKHVDGPVELEEVRAILEYPVAKVEVCLNAPDKPYDKNVVDDAFMLVDENTGRAIHKSSVSDSYKIHQNSEFLDNLQFSLLEATKDDGDPAYPNICIESAGTLFGLNKAFVNILLDQFHVTNDNSETVTRLMYYNAFGGTSLATGAHNTRIVCNNTLKLAMRQSEINETLGKFKHTKNSASRMRDHLVSLTNIYVKAEAQKEALNRFAVTPMTATDLDNFVKGLFPIPVGAQSRGVSVKTNNRTKVADYFENLDDLQGKIARTRYSALQAVTYYTGNDMGNRNTDELAGYFNSATGGNKDEFNQRAFKLLDQEFIPKVDDPALVTV